jgi:hypothetical protein
MFPQALKTFPSSFKREFEGLNIQKELFPYRYYSFERLSSGELGNINEVGDDERPKWTDEQKKTFRHNCELIDCIVNETQFDLMKYCEFYCQQDVNVLRIGFNAFRDSALKDPINTDIFEFLTAPSLANDYLLRHVFYPNGNVYEYTGVLKDYIMGAIYGGRCMTRDNKRFHVMDKLDDFDACSLYPSAMNRLFTVEGIPKLIEPCDLNREWILSHAFKAEQTKASVYRFISQCIVDIKIESVGIDRHFSTIVKREDGKNINCNECVNMRVDLLTLQDLVQYQNVEFTVLGGIYWTGNRDLRVRSVIKTLFEERARYKREGNSIQTVLKLIMNSSYGKSIQKSIESYEKFVASYDYDRFMARNWHRILEITDVANSDSRNSTIVYSEFLFSQCRRE